MLSRQPFNILILCTGNSARSIMAEALFNTLPEQKFRAYSAGSNPTGQVHPLALELIESIGYPTQALRSKSWDEFSVEGAPHMDFILTVCDRAAGQACPIWPGHPISAHWGFEDPAAYQGTVDEQRKCFLKVFHQIRQRVQIFSALPLHSLERAAIQHEIRQIGQLSPSE